MMANDIMANLTTKLVKISKGSKKVSQLIVDALSELTRLQKLHAEKDSRKTFLRRGLEKSVILNHIDVEEKSSTHNQVDFLNAFPEANSSHIEVSPTKGQLSLSSCDVMHLDITPIVDYANSDERFIDMTLDDAMRSFVNESVSVLKAPNIDKSSLIIEDNNVNTLHEPLNVSLRPSDDLTAAGAIDIQVPDKRRRAHLMYY
ncbi:hypothetical protein Bhyg_07983 [Pseudolycoriella hygida]|uniref:Uncharacterized protein n=1 Tax=Pseudolycoriella hygida TaxID=35572 RepID=A0A9Q0N3T1_9DIPT|nr:hypothetical protein Bhyg_07983 [Pseudolycoriella hygida]